jgi:hypothetical protein
VVNKTKLTLAARSRGCEPSPSAVPGERSSVSSHHLDTDIVVVMPASAADGAATARHPKAASDMRKMPQNLFGGASSC